VTGGEENTAVCLVLPDDVGGSWGGEDGILSNNKLLDTISGANLENGLNSFGREKAAITADNESRAIGID
jgi:hypothetical protein